MSAISIEWRTIAGTLASTPWVELAGNTLGGVGLPDSILSGEKAAERIWAAIGHRFSSQTGRLKAP